MKVQFEMDPRDVWRIQDLAEKQGVTPGDIVRAEMSRRRNHLELHNRVRSRVLALMCDADIADELRLGVTAVRDIRQKHLRLPANPRYRRPTEKTNETNGSE